MTKNKKKVEDDEIDLTDIAKGTKGAILSNVPGVNYFIDTGNLALNYSNSGRYFGGGWPGDRIIEIQGPSSGGKSYWAMNAVRGCQAIGGICIYLDCENAINPFFAAQTSHIDADKLIRYGPKDGIDHLEGVFLKVYNVITKVREKYPTRPLLFVYDSISVSPCKRELNETKLTEDFTKEQWKKVVGGKEQPGERAKICNKEFRKLEAIIEEKKVSMLVINQLRQKIGVMYGNPEVGAAASTVLEYYASCRVRASAHKKIENKELDTVVGINLKIKNIKNRTFRPFAVAEDIQLFFDKGVNPISGLLTSLKSAERIELVAKNKYKVKEPWADGQEVVFEGKVSKNLMDPEILYKCPKLVDAKDADEIRDYLKIFDAAIQESLSEKVSEKDFNEESEEPSVED